MVVGRIACHQEALLTERRHPHHRLNAKWRIKNSELRQSGPLSLFAIPLRVHIRPAFGHLAEDTQGDRRQHPDCGKGDPDEVLRFIGIPKKLSGRHRRSLNLHGYQCTRLKRIQSEQAGRLLWRARPILGV